MHKSEVDPLEIQRVCSKCHFRYNNGNVHYTDKDRIFTYIDHDTDGIVCQTHRYVYTNKLLTETSTEAYIAGFGLLEIAPMRRDIWHYTRLDFPGTLKLKSDGVDIDRPFTSIGLESCEVIRGILTSKAKWNENFRIYTDERGRKVKTLL